MPVPRLPPHQEYGRGLSGWSAGGLGTAMARVVVAKRASACESNRLQSL